MFSPESLLVESSSKLTPASDLTSVLGLQNLNVLMVGAKDGKGGFFPEGIAGRINTPEGFDALAEGIEDFKDQEQATQVGLSNCILASVASATGCNVSILCCWQCLTGIVN